MDSFHDAQSRGTKSTTSQVTLRRPVQIVKKRSGPLNDVLAELNKSEAENIATITTSTTTRTKTTKTCLANATIVSRIQSGAQVKGAGITTTVTRPSPTSSRRRSTLKDKEKKRERWLLTRKTWKYMTDAGRKLIPDGAQNRSEDIPKIEAHFQKVCASEPHFVLWRRKSSYPGAMRNSKKRLKQLLQHTGQKSHQVIEQEEINNANLVLQLLHNHLKLDEAIKTDTLLGTKTEGPHQTNSPSAQRPKPLSSLRKGDGMTASLRGPGFLPPPTVPAKQLSEVDQLLQRLMALSRSTTLPESIHIKPEEINAELLNDKTTLKKLYNALKKQQLHRILSKHSMPSKPRTNLTYSTSMLSLLHFGNSNTRSKPNSTDLKLVGTKIPTQTSSTTISSVSHQLTSTHVTINRQTARSITMPVYPAVPQRQRKPPSSLDLPNSSNISNIGSQDQHQRHALPEKQMNSCGVQTNFIPLSEIKRLAEEYKEYKREEMATEAGGSGGGGNTTTDDEAEKQSSAHRRKSSIDNEDVSQSVSDTIKRYLRMARKKSVHDDNANRFKRVNYDRNLRNIQAKGEINLPGMDEDNNKAVQTLDAWALITLDFIRGNENSGVLETAHTDWQKALDERIQRKLEYEQKLINQSKEGHQSRQVIYQSTSSCSSSSAPTSPTPTQTPTMTNQISPSSAGSTYDSGPTIAQINIGNTTGVSGSSAPDIATNVGGIFHSGSQFIANLWHGTTSSSNSSSPSSVATNNKHGQHSLSTTDCIDVNIALNNCPDMLKSKSSSHVGQYVSSKLLKGHLKSQSKSVDSTSSSSTPKVPKWSRSGKCSWCSETGDRILLGDTAFHILSELEAKMVQKICLEKITELNIGVDLSGLIEAKSYKRRLLTKKKAMTTSFFDIGKKDSNITDSNTSLFGNSLEGCVNNDKKREMSNLSASSDRGSRSSIVSLFRVGSSGGGGKNSVNTHKLNENVRSCESLPTGAGDNTNAKTNTKTSTISNYFGNLAKSASMQMSRSQSDVRRGSSELSSPMRDNDDSTTDEQITKELQVPKFVTSCIHYLEENGLHKVGLFRVSTSKKRVKQLRDSFDKNLDKSFDVDTCPHNVATLLKEFLRDLPEPLLSNKLYKAFLETQKIRNRRLQLEAISHLVKLLPPAHRDTLYVLLKFLAKVAACSDDINNTDGTVHLTGNKMDSNNLATVFAPNILRTTVNYKSSSSPSGDYLKSTREQESISDAINVIRIMIDHYEELFRVPAEVLDLVYSQLLDEAPDKLYNICEHHKTTMHNFIQFY